MLKVGVKVIADSRVENIKHMRKSGLNTDFMLLRTPMISEITEVVEHVDVSLNSELRIINELSLEALNQGKVHNVLLMVEMGDLREGITIDEADNIVEETLSLEGVNLSGIGMNLACFGGVVPTDKKIKEFSEMVSKLESKFNVNFNLISGGNSANIPSLIDNVNQGKINNLRVGEGILLGLETVNRTPIPNTYQDAFTIEGELIELKHKPSVPYGEISQNAFGETPAFEEQGDIRRAIIALGKQDVIVKDLQPLNKQVEILGSSSDHIILNLNKADYKIGDKIKFNMKYGALVHLFTSKYVKKQYLS